MLFGRFVFVAKREDERGKGGLARKKPGFEPDLGFALPNFRRELVNSLFKSNNGRKN